MEKISIFWFRRDIRLEDNAGLYNALQSHSNVLPIFIFDTKILQELPKQDARVEFIHAALMKVQSTLVKQHTSLKIIHATPQEAFEQLMNEYDI